MNIKKIIPSSNNTSKNNLKIMALGGLGEVGKNCYVIESDEDLFVIDYGVIFPDKSNLGIDSIIPNFSYLKNNQHRIKALFITHGHEDHIGGIPFLIKSLHIPMIYATLTAKLMIERKFKEHNINCPITLIDAHSKLTFGNVQIETFSQAHSIPDAVGLFFATPRGNIVTTGDFKVDFAAAPKNANDFYKIVELAQRGILCLMSDSTNAITPGFSLSEYVVGENLKTLIKEAKGRIIFTTFASNINRLEQIIQGALLDKRKICVLGRSLTNALTIGQKTKHLNFKNTDIIEAKHIKNYAPQDICIICTGSQGEELAALSRIANGLNFNIELDCTDTIVFASNPIPGNNYPIGKIIDSLTKKQCKVIKNTNVFKTHASGHASEEEQKLLLTLFKPKYFMPIHGKNNMLLTHQQSAIKTGMKKENIFITDNGDQLDLTHDKPTILRKIAPNKSMFVSGNNINVSTDSEYMHQLASDGVIVFTTTYDKNKVLISYPQTSTRGFVIINSALQLLKKIQVAFIESYHACKNLPTNEVEQAISLKMSNFIYKETGKKPFILTNLIKYNPTKTKITLESFDQEFKTK